MKQWLYLDPFYEDQYVCVLGGGGITIETDQNSDVGKSMISVSIGNSRPHDNWEIIILTWEEIL